MKSQRTWNRLRAISQIPQCSCPISRSAPSSSSSSSSSSSILLSFSLYHYHHRYHYCHYHYQIIILIIIIEVRGMVVRCEICVCEISRVHVAREINKIIAKIPITVFSLCAARGTPSRRCGRLWRLWCHGIRRCRRTTIFCVPSVN